MKIKNVLISQPKPTDLDKSPYAEAIKNFNLNVDFHKFFSIEGLTSIEFRKENKIRISDFTGVILTSKHSVDHFFRLANELRVETLEDMKYICISESIAYYLQYYIQFRKRKIFFANRDMSDLPNILKKNKVGKFLFPCNEEYNSDLSNILDKYNIQYQRVLMFRTVSEDMSMYNMANYDLIVFFSPHGIKSLFKNFPDFKQGSITIGAFGASTIAYAREMKLKVAIKAPTPKAPSMAKAIELYLSSRSK